MLINSDYRQVRDSLLAQIGTVGTEAVSLHESAGRVLAQSIAAAEDVPSFDRSPYDGYAFRALDVAAASPERPVTLQVIDYIAAGDVPHTALKPGTAVHLMTGAPVPEDADAVLPFESTEFTENTVTIRSAVAAGSNVIRTGEDVRKGDILCEAGVPVDAGLAGTLAGQGIFAPLVYKKPLVGVISTGSELLQDEESPERGKIYNSNRYALQIACADAGCRSIYIGTAQDTPGEIREMILRALKCCDAVLLSGGVSVGDYDCTPEAMDRAGIRILARGLSLKPGMAGAYGIHEGIPVMALSGNPAACMTAFYAVVLPVLNRLAGRRQVLPQEIRVRLPGDYSRKKQGTRLLRGKMDPAAVVQEVQLSERQGNQMLHSFSGANVFVEIPAGRELRKGDTADAFVM